jgi:NAD(P)-dependent dehydrogenase (short-subunit alcohol dehydrogenase family)
MGRLDGRVAVVTGAGGGIGASVARALASEGAAVVVNDLGVNVDGTGGSADPANEVAETIRQAGGRALANHDNVVDHDAAEHIIRSALDEFGRMDILVNVAGILRDRMVFNLAEKEWDAVIAVHMKGTFNTTKFASIHWRQARQGHYRLINFTSGSGLHGAPGQPNYAAAKMGIVGFTYSCANALGRYGVTANAIAPGAATRMTGTIPDERRRGVGLNQQSDEMSPDNVAPAVVYLATEQSDWLTGRVIGAAGYRISLYSNPEVIREIQSTGPWNLDDAFRYIERSFKPAVLGRTTFGRGPAGQGQPQQAEPPTDTE